MGQGCLAARFNAGLVGSAIGEIAREASLSHTTRVVPRLDHRAMIFVILLATEVRGERGLGVLGEQVLYDLGGKRSGGLVTLSGGRQYQNLGYFRVLGILFTRSATTSMIVAPNPAGMMTYR